MAPVLALKQNRWCDGEGSNRRLGSGQAISVADTGGSYQNSSALKRAFNIPPANGEKQIPQENGGPGGRPVSEQQVGNLRGCFGGGDKDATSIVVAMLGDKKKRVHIVEKNYIGSSDQAINGSQKRSFSVMSRTDSDTTSSTFGTVGFAEERNLKVLRSIAKLNS